MGSHHNLFCSKLRVTSSCSLYMTTFSLRREQLNLAACHLFSALFFFTIPKWIAHHWVKANYIKLKSSIPRPRKQSKVFPESYFVGMAPKSRLGCLCSASPTAELFYLDLSTVLLCSVVCVQMPFPK